MISAGNQQVLGVVAESSTCMRLEFKQKRWAVRCWRGRTCRQSGRPSKGCCASGGASIQVAGVGEARPGSMWASWKAGALHHSNANVRSAKVDFVRMLAARATVWALEEFRPTSYGLRQLLRSLETSHWVVASGESGSFGGVAVLIALSFCKRAPHVAELVRGRAMQVWVADGIGEVNSACMHNSELGNQDMKHVAMTREEDPVGRRAAPKGDSNLASMAAGIGSVGRRRPDRILARAL